MPPTYTYSNDPSTSGKDAVRFLCQDTDMTTGSVRLADEEINWILAFQTTNLFLAAAACADIIAGYWSKVQNTVIGPLAIQRGTQPAEYYQQLAEALRRMANRFANASPVFYPADQLAYQNTNCGRGGPQHIFKVGQEDFPGYSRFWPPADLPPLGTYP
jgi:hypothetical protein